ncbi:MAG TPA: M10 family metallopeptidase [Allosphingosinicella sp.]|nr:M10 family metallopeptidase [Allosphingosinicella sp.]
MLRREYEGDIVRSAIGAIAPNGKPIFTIDQVVSQLTRSGTAWNGIGANPVPAGGLGVISYAFFDFAAQVYSSEQSQFAPLSAAQRAAVRDAFAIWGEYLGITFVEGNVATADINLGNINTTETYFSAYASFPDKTRVGGDIWFNLNAATNQELGLAQPGFRTILHEMGHALGLSHPSNYNAAPGVTLTYDANAQYYQDSLQYTIMSYFASSSTGAIRSSFAATPMAHDVAALQSLYGANMTIRTGDTVYGFNSNAGRATYDFTQNTAPVIAIWDAGGRDTLDFSGWNSASRIDLEPGASSDGGGQTANVQIAYGALIENAIGGGGDDLISGNNANNGLQGGGGNDRLNGLFGTDRAEGGTGADIFVFTDVEDSPDYLRRSDGAKWTADVLPDFTSGVDRIDLSAIDAKPLTPGDDPFVFLGTAAFTGHAGELRYEMRYGFIHILGDINGDGATDLHIVASGTQVLAGDFVL